MAHTKALTLAIALLAAPLAGCGFTPLYATPAVSPALASISLDLPGTSRTGYLLKEQLNRTLAHDQAEASHYRLAIVLNERRFPGGVRVNNVANRYELDATATYVLTDAATGKVLYRSAATTEVSYDSSDPPYAGVVANQDGEQRAAGQLAVLIQLGLARYFAHQALPG